MDLSKVCRVCAGTGVLLELFGSKTQAVSYAEDVNKCLSLEATKGDGLPSHICVSCVGLINECLRFVNKLKNVGGESHGQRRRGSSDSSRSKSCYFCESTENHLFPLSETSANKTNDCFNIKVADKETICYRCQFCLDTVHDLKLKACASLKKFYSNSLTTKEVEKASSKKMQSVGEIVSSLKNKFNVGKKISLPMEVKVSVIDFVVVIGSDILSKGTINVNEFMELIQLSSSKNGDVPHREKKRARPTSLKPATKTVAESSAEPRSSRPSPKRHQRVTFDVKTVQIESDDTEVSTSTPSAPSKKKRSRVASDSEEEKPSKKTCAAFESPNTPSSTTNLIESPRQTRRNSLTADKEDTPQGNIETEEPKKETVSSRSKKNSPRPKSKMVSKKESSSSTTVEKTVEMDSPGPMESSKENISENSFVDEVDKSSKRKRSRKEGNYSKFFGEESPPAKIQRKRRDSEEKDFFSSKGKKKQWKSSTTDGSDVDDPSSSTNKNSLAGDQPDFLRELDELLRHTPKSTFRPFICSVCREGYVSTVKGMLHKLVMHDPHSNILLKLTRCDDDGEMKRLKETIPFNFGSTEKESSYLVNNVNNHVESADSDDELFPESQPISVPTAVSSDPFDSLVSSSNCQTVCESRLEEPEISSSELQNVETDVKSSDASLVKPSNEDEEKNESKINSVSEGAKTDDLAGDDLVDDSKEENVDLRPQDEPDGIKSGNDLNIEECDKLDKSDNIQEEPSGAVEKISETSENATSVKDSTENQTKEPDVGEDEGVSQDEKETEQAGEGEREPKESLESESQHEIEETANNSSDAKEQSTAGNDERDESSPINVDEGSSETPDSGAQKIEETKSEIQGESLRSEEVDNINSDPKDSDKLKDAPAGDDVESVTEQQEVDGINDEDKDSDKHKDATVPKDVESVDENQKETLSNKDHQEEDSLQNEHQSVPENEEKKIQVPAQEGIAVGVM